jgi:hypothetical protein
MSNLDLTSLTVGGIPPSYVSVDAAAVLMGVAGQVLGQHRIQLAGMTEGKLPQQRSHRRRGIHPVKEGFHAARADQVDIVDVIRPRAHARDQGGQFRGRVGRPRLDPRGRDVNLVGQQL